MSESTQANSDQPTIVYGAGRKPDAAIPRPGMELCKSNVAVVVTDPQNDFLSPEGVTWGVVGQNVTDNNTIENIIDLLNHRLGHVCNIVINLYFCQRSRSKA